MSQYKKLYPIEFKYEQDTVVLSFQENDFSISYMGKTECRGKRMTELEFYRRMELDTIQDISQFENSYCYMRGNFPRKNYETSIWDWSNWIFWKHSTNSNLSDRCKLDILKKITKYQIGEI